MLNSTALLTDHYELTMVRAAMRSGAAFRRSVFELFPRRLPTGRRYGVVAGVGRALESIEAFTFDAPRSNGCWSTIVDEPLAQWLADYRFGGSIWGYPEGEIYFPGSPLMIVEGSFAEAVILETVLLSIYNYDSAVASAASRMTAMAGERPCIEMGSRRTNEIAAVAAARAAFVAGFATTSNLEAGRRYGVPTRGTAAHSFTLLHETEREAFHAQLASLGESTTLLVDTYDIETAVRTGVQLTDGRLGAIRLDSGDLAELAGEVRTCWTRWAPPRPGSSSRPTWTSGRSPRCGGPRWTASASGRPWSPVPAHPPVGSSTSWSPGPTPTIRTPRCSRSRRRA